jgi:hypothetical protein
MSFKQLPTSGMRTRPGGALCLAPARRYSGGSGRFIECA